VRCCTWAAPAVVVAELTRDWGAGDDSILPTSFLAHRQVRLEDGLKNLDQPAIQALAELDAMAVKMIAKAVELAHHVTIVTNAEERWIEQSSEKFLPGVCAALRQVSVVSARSKYERTYPSADMWKKTEFREQVEAMYSKLDGREEDAAASADFALCASPDAVAMNVISIGDSEYERDAMWAAKGAHSGLIVKTIKLMNAPTVHALTLQLNTVTSSLEHIVGSLESLDLKLQANPISRRDSAGSL
jgi:hypothetical protein